MTTKVNRIPFNTLPQSWAFDAEVGPFVRDLLDTVFQLRERTGGDSGPPRLPSYIVAEVPNVIPAGQIIYVSDESGGAVLAFSDGTNWRRSTDRAIVS